MSTTRPDRSRARRAALAAGVAVALAGLLSGCGEAHPGAAAVVDGQRVPVADVDAMTGAVCTLAAQSASGALPLGYLRSLALEASVKRAVGERLADEYDLAPGPAYRQSVAQLESKALGLPEEVQDRFVSWQSAATYLADISEQIARRQLAEEGAEVTVDGVTARASAIVAEWAQEHQISVDPRYDVRVSGDVYRQSGSLLVQTTSPLSLSASEDALAAEYLARLVDSGLRADDDPERLTEDEGQKLFTKLTTWAGSLPPDQRCPGTASGG